MFLKFPRAALHLSLTGVEKAILLQLISLHFTHCGDDYNEWFYVTDRELASLVWCSTHTIYETKRHLSDLKLLEYTRGKGNKTYYRLTDPGP